MRHGADLEKEIFFSISVASSDRKLRKEQNVQRGCASHVKKSDVSSVENAERGCALHVGERVPQSGTVKCARLLWRANGECRLEVMLGVEGALDSEGRKMENEGGK